MICMTNLHCGVASCTYNGDNLCSKHRIQVESGKGSGTFDTCCVSYQSATTAADRPAVSNLSAANNHPEPETDVACSAGNCLFNLRGSCGADEITVAGLKNTTHCTQTKCRSFRE